MGTDLPTGALMASISWILGFSDLPPGLAIVAGRVRCAGSKPRPWGWNRRKWLNCSVIRMLCFTAWRMGSSASAATVASACAIVRHASCWGFRIDTSPPTSWDCPTRDAGLPTRWSAPPKRGAGTLRLETDKSALVATVHPVLRENHDLGKVVLLRDVTTIETLGSRLDAVETMAGALRAQRHEFANRLHTISGLLRNGDVDEAQEYLGEVIESGPVREPVQNLGAIEDTYLRAFLGAKGVRPTSWAWCCASVMKARSTGG